MNLVRKQIVCSRTPVAAALADARRQGGFSMIEMVISVAIGLLVTSAVLYTVSSSGVSGRKQEVQSTIHDVGSMAMVQLAEHVRMAGFSVPLSEVGAGDVFEGGEKPLFGCSTGFVMPAAGQPWNWNDLACAPGAAGSADAIAVRFQVQSGGRNWDCMGHSATNVAGSAAAAPRGPNAAAPALQSDEIQEAFFVRRTGTASGNPGLFCRSSLQPGAEQLIADNVDQFRIRYGVSSVNGAAQDNNRAFDAPALLKRTVMYRSADELDPSCAAGELPDNSWCAVNTVQLCLVMRSDDNVNDEASTPYVDCDGEVRTVNDRRLRQAFTMTVAVRNKIGE